MYLCCRTCMNQCADACHNNPDMCNVHMVIEVPGKVRGNRHTEKNCIVVDPKTGQILAEYKSITEAIMLRFGTRKKYEAAMRNGEIAVTREEGRRDAARSD